MDDLDSSIKALEDRIQSSARASAAQREAETTSLRRFRTESWDTTLRLALDTLTSKLGRAAHLSGGCQQRLHDTMRDVASLCAHKFSTDGLAINHVAEALPFLESVRADIADPMYADAHTRELRGLLISLTALLDRQVHSQNMRMLDNFQATERALADLVANVKGVSRRAWEQHRALQTSVRDAENRLQAMRHRGMRGVGGGGSGDASAELRRIETDSAVSRSADRGAQAEAQQAAHAQVELRRQIDRLDMSVNALVARQLECAKEKVRFMTGLGQASARVSGAHATLDHLEKEYDALTTQVAKLEGERREAQDALKACMAPMPVSGGGRRASDTQARTMRNIAKAKASKQAREQAAHAALCDALEERAKQEAERSGSAIVNDATLSLRQARDALQKRQQAEVMEHDAAYLLRQRDLRRAIDTVERNVIVHGGAHYCGTLKQAARNLANRAITQRVQTHMKYVEDVLRTTQEFINTSLVP